MNTVLQNSTYANSSYQELLLTQEWRTKRLEILHRDGNACRVCGSTNSLQVHHMQYHTSKANGSKLFPWMYKNKYLITLCECCHKAGHQQYQIPVFAI